MGKFISSWEYFYVHEIVQITQTVFLLIFKYNYKKYLKKWVGSCYNRYRLMSWKILIMVVCYTLNWANEMNTVIPLFGSINTSSIIKTGNIIFSS